MKGLEAGHLIYPDWPAPMTVRALSTTRSGGVSDGVWSSLNLGLHVGDKADRVAENRRRLGATIGADISIQWLNQVHGTAVLDAGIELMSVPNADASYTQQAGVACAVMTADCLPVLLCSEDGSEVAAAHCGWRGLAAGVLSHAVKRFRHRPTDIMAWLGPAIGPAAFEVGADVAMAFRERAEQQQWRARVDDALVPLGHHQYRADLYRLARFELAALGCHQVYGGGECTFSDEARFFSYRRDGQTGRMASVIWRTD